MLNRDYSVSNKDYFKKNRVYIIILSVFLMIGIIMAIAFGFRGNFDFTGHYSFSVDITQNGINDISRKAYEIGQVVNSHKGEYDTYQVYDEGENSRIVINFVRKVDNDALRAAVAEKLGVEVSSIGEITYEAGTVKTSDYIYTVATLLVVVMCATLFAYFRYNGASALTVLLTAILSTLGLLTFTSVLRLTIGRSYFAMLVLMNLLVMYFEFAIFERTRSTSWLASKNYNESMDDAVNSVKNRVTIMSIAVLLLGLLMIIFAPGQIKYVSLNILFMAVVLLASIVYIVPFIWRVFINKCKVRVKKTK